MMKVMVAVKRVVDANVKIRINAEHTAIDTGNLKMSLNPFCEIAVEEAVRLKESGKVDDILVVCVGPSAAQEQLRTALALGADRAILIQTEDRLSPLVVAKALAVIQQRERADLLLLGKQSIDSDNSQTGPMLAALADLPQATYASKIALEENLLTVWRELDGGTQQLQLSLPALVSADLRLNEPRYASLPNIMKAKRKPLEVVTLAELGVVNQPQQQLVSVVPPAPRQAGVMVDSVETLVAKLKQEAKVI